MLLPLLDFDPATKWAAIILAILTVVYATVRPLFRKKDPLARPPAFGSLAQQRSVERQMQNVLVEMSEMARQITAQLDTRAAKLEALIREADEKIATLKSTPGQQESPEVLSQPHDQPIFDPGHSVVYALADKGRSSAEIAHELNRPRGEIELILALRR
jgi:hypothetical protein